MLDSLDCRLSALLADKRLCTIGTGASTSLAFSYLLPWTLRHIVIFDRGRAVVNRARSNSALLHFNFECRLETSRRRSACWVSIYTVAGPFSEVFSMLIDTIDERLQSRDTVAIAC